MNRNLTVLIVLVLILTACTPAPESDPTPIPSPTTTRVPPPTNTPIPTGKTIVVENPSDDDAGSFRSALLLAEPYDTITFDPGVFDPNDPATIQINSPLPEVNREHLTIDASDAGVILDGGGGEFGALSVNAQYITIQGLHIVNFNGTAITLWENAHHNTVGGDPQTGAGPLGQGNLMTGNRDGIIIQKGSKSHTIAGNQIGVEFNGLVGNTYTGIQILDYSPGNTIGPDNVIAYSGAPGLEIKTEDAPGTTITRNLIFGDYTTLLMIPQARHHVEEPVILSYDPAGTVSGVACSECEVEIFSGEERQMEFFEGSVTAGPDGSFTFSAGVPFRGVNVKATATTPTGATSNMSVHTPGNDWTLMLQEGNTLPASVFYSLSSSDISEDNRISQFGWFPYCSEDAIWLDAFGGLGLKQILPDFNEMEVPYWLETPEFPSADIHDKCINDWKRRGMEITYILTFWDKQFQLDGGELPCERFATVGPDDPETQRFLEYVREVAIFMLERDIHKYEVWNEPDNYVCTQGITPSNYIKLVDLLVPVIKEVDPEAKVYVGAQGTAFAFARQHFLEIADSDEIMPIVEGLSWHPFFGPSPESELPEYVVYYNNYTTFVEEIKERAEKSGFTGEYKADSLTWRTPQNADPGQPGVYQELEAAKYYARGLVLHLGMDVATGTDVGGGNHQYIYYTVRNISTVMAGNHAAAMEVEIDTTTTNILSYGFRMDNGTHLFALWTNGAAVEFDPGVKANLTFTFEGEVPASVTGIDVLHGYTQPLEFKVNDNQLIIQDLRVKDYPIIIQFGDAP